MMEYRSIHNEGEGEDEDQYEDYEVFTVEITVELYERMGAGAGKVATEDYSTSVFALDAEIALTIAMEFFKTQLLGYDTPGDGYYHIEKITVLPGPIFLLVQSK